MRGVTQVRSIKARKWWMKRSTLFAVAVCAAIASVGAIMVFAQAPPMDPPVMTPMPVAMVDVSWLPVAPIGANDTTYTLSYDTTYPFTATQTITTIATSYSIDGVDGVTYYAIVQADDGSGVLSDPSAVAQATADGRAPVSSFVPSPVSPNGAHGWYTSATASISVVETNSGLQTLIVNSTDVGADPGMVFAIPPDPSTYVVPLSQGLNTFSFSGTDVAGNVETPDKTASLSLDSVAPTCAIAVSASGPTSQSITATMTAGDASPGSGVDRIEYAFLARGTSPSGGTVWTSVTASSVTTSAPQGRLTLFARSFDVAGNVSATQSADVFRDTAAPVTTLVTVPASPTGPSGSWLHAPAISLQVADTDPVTTTYYSWNNTATVATVGTSPVVPAGAGVQTLRFFSVDSAGNVESTHVVTFLVQDQQSYTITFNSNGGSAVPPITQLFGSAVATPTAPTLAGNTFAGWFSDVGLTTPYTFTTMPSANITLYAKWTSINYSIAFNSNGGSAVATITQAAGSAVTTPTAPTKTGNTFAGWFSDVGLTTPYTFTTMPAANITVYVKWTVNSYTITFNSVGGSAVVAITQAFGSAVTAPAAPTKSGYTFAGWYSDAGLTTPYTFSTMPSANITLYAKWTASSYTITFVSNGGSAVAAITQEVGSTIVPPTPPTRTGYTFAGWFSDAGLTTPYVFFTSMPAANTTAYAKWTISTYTLTYTAGANGAIVGTSPQTVDYGSNGTTVTAMPADGYHFVSWSDGYPTAERRDLDVTVNHAVSATFASMQVATRLTMNVNPARLTLGHSAHFFGVIAPNVPDRTPIALLVRKAGQTKWRRAGFYVRTSNGHHWSTYYHPNTRGTYYFKVQFSATDVFAGSTSRTVTVVWR
jgi:uncharacterized repeat protein (TIGR02543 family)